MLLGTYIFLRPAYAAASSDLSVNKPASIEYRLYDGSQFAKNSPTRLTLWLIGSHNRHHPVASITLHKETPTQGGLGG
jgi:4-diphosphocytidyl-2C-methyl-D-erythritol kinase